jgi:hypothetical protein
MVWGVTRVLDSAPQAVRREYFYQMFASLSASERAIVEMMQRTIHTLSAQLTEVADSSREEERQFATQKSAEHKRQIGVVLACIVALTNAPRQRIALDDKLLPDEVLREAIDVLEGLPSPSVKTQKDDVPRARGAEFHQGLAEQTQPLREVLSHAGVDVPDSTPAWRVMDLARRHGLVPAEIGGFYPSPASRR